MRTDSKTTTESYVGFRTVVRYDNSERKLSEDESRKIRIVLGDGELLTTNEAASLLDVSRPMIVRWIKAGLLPDQWVGTQHRVPLDSVLALKSQRLDASRNAMADVLAARTDPQAARATSLARAAAAERRARIAG